MSNTPPTPPPKKRRLWRILRLPLLLSIRLLAYLLWSPGTDLRSGRHDLATNALWLQHGWLGDDTWFTRNAKDPAPFRTAASLQQATRLWRSHHIRYLFPHLCPAQSNGDIAPSDPAQVEQFLDAAAADALDVLPWVGGVRGDSARPHDPAWRRRFSLSCAALLTAHPRLAGIHLNIEPMPSGDADFLTLLDDLRRALPPGKTLSIAAYPPPTRWQRNADVHWDEPYSRAVAARVDQVAVMMYDTAIPLAKPYQSLMKRWTTEVLDWYAPKQVLLGIPAYEDAGTGYHDPRIENIPNALAGIHAALAPHSLPPHYAGLALYSEWQMTPEKWSLWQQRFLRRTAATQD